MAEIKVIPTVIVHQINNGGSLTGVAPVGSPLVDSGQTVRRGRYRKFSALTDGGLIDIPETVARNGYKILSVLVNIPGMSSASFYVVDRDGNDVGATSITLTGGVGYREWRNFGLLVAPGCSFRVTGVGTASADGQVMFVLGDGWGHSMFDSAPQLGSSSLPPSEERT